MKKTLHLLKHMIILIICSAFGYLNISCNESDNQTNPKTILCDSSVYVTDNECRTMQSFQKIDPYPFYTMTFYGDYGFEDYLKTGLYQRSAGTTGGKSDSVFHCTCFAVNNESGTYFGRNFDWYHRPSMLLFTDSPKGYASASMVDLFYAERDYSGDYESMIERLPLLRTPYLTFDGMNEKGVAIGIMAVPHAEPPYDPDKVTIHDLSVVRLVLDYASSSDEAVALIGKYNVRFDGVFLHYMIADRSGKSVIVEFVNGQMKVTRNKYNYQVCTNFVIEDAKPDFSGRCWRYDSAWVKLSTAPNAMTSGLSMNLLQTVSQNTTKWSLVYNLTTGGILACVGREYENLYNFSLNMK